MVDRGQCTAPRARKHSVFVAAFADESLRGALFPFLGFLAGADLAFELVDHLVDRRVHVFARLVRVIVRAPSVEVDLCGVKPALAAELHLSLHWISEKFLEAPDL